MQTIDAILKFFATYPSWAKVVMLAGLLVVVATALLSPRLRSNGHEARQPSQPVSLDERKVYYLTITRVTPFDLPDGAAVKIVAFVNDTPFHYPSVGNVDWLGVGPSMPPQTFRLPKAAEYTIRFEMEMKARPGELPLKFKSQRLIRVASTPYSEEYELYPLTEEGRSITHASNVAAAIPFKVSTDSEV